MSEPWGMYGDKPPCEHLLALRKYLTEAKLSVYGEGTDEPEGWVNVCCAKCRRTYEVTLQKPWKGAPE